MAKQTFTGLLTLEVRSSIASALKGQINRGFRQARRLSSADQNPRPANAGGAGPRPADAFAGLASLLRVQPELQQVCRFGAQWSSEHGPEEWTLDELAEHALTSRATLVRLFRKAVDVPPLAFLADLRLNLARHRLRATAAPLALIAEEVGYSSETAFSRVYHRRFGRPPGSERAMPEAGPDPRRRTPDAAAPV